MLADEKATKIRELYEALKKTDYLTDKFTSILKSLGN